MTTLEPKETLACHDPTGDLTTLPTSQMVTRGETQESIAVGRHTYPVRSTSGNLKYHLHNRQEKHQLADNYRHSQAFEGSRTMECDEQLE